MEQLRWPSGKNVRLLSCRFGFDSESGQAFTGIDGVPALRFLLKGTVWRTSRQVVPLGKALGGVPPFRFGRQVVGNS